ncbi:hypothetical protein DNL40_03220 [Xylanimonas oleitrophica]|uniref:DUF4439 domain-containing protein n=1 Tax=Xylanimonas oleitrophica TaxID=2607479 RepID=A0A2W5X369_9MICO|nr:DUF4439 domain-containing protein [Xylanimonas oleitrophica]PZR55386.1 hypothetical protein DNL40_03220 [Xylanimonas oleitrophica]
MEPHPPASRRARPLSAPAAVRAVVLAVAVALLAGCGVRLESPPPSEPVPDATELVRRTAVADALLVAERAGSTTTSPDLPAPVLDELGRIAQDAHAHARELGGEYRSGIEEPDEEAEPSAEPTATGPATPEAVVVTLVDAAARNRAAASSTSGGDLGRLLASVSAAQTVAATRLAALSGIPTPQAPSPQVPEPSQEEALPATPTPSASEPGSVETTAPGDGPVRPPQGMTAADYRALVASEDGARYALEVRAARADGDVRARLLDRSRAHGQRAEAWARLGAVDGTDQDPRRVAYQVPADDDAVLVRTLERGLAVDYATLVGTTAPGSRGVLVDLLVDGALTLDAWGQAPSPFPGMPELDG